MKTSAKKKKATIVALYGLFIYTLAGSLCGTFAWYTYGTRVPVTYEGISIGDYGSLEIGMCSEYELSQAECARFALTADYSVAGKKIYWSTGSFPGPAMGYILEKNGFASSYMYPITAGKYDGPGDEFILRNPPTYNQKYLYHSVRAGKSNYAQLDLVFRYQNASDEELGGYTQDYSVYLAQATAVSDSSIHKGLRMYVYGIERNMLINPNTAEAKALKAGGPLDLDNNGYYDSVRVGLNPQTGKDIRYQFAYGEFENGSENSNAMSLINHYRESGLVSYAEGPAEDTVYYQDLDRKDRSTFDADLEGGTYVIDENNTEFPYIHFEGLKSLTKKDAVLAKPDKFKNYYAFATVIVYLEGWDRAVDNKQVLTNFSFDLLFEAY